ncbi:MAG: radical SAM family heme chaperone HemW [Bacteroidetes bacterium]|nr:radical SAM family heme chaperone HemW [Bacteroidota bacterium]MBS1540578.1 radical SAM family heme chaperone HemW [Bacteroidota bacterium]
MAGIYIHIPFCKQACHYCDFHFSTQLSSKPKLVESICLELILQKDYLGGEKIETIYFGGGTPSLLSEAELRAIVETLSTHFTITASPEITLEANPDDLSDTTLSVLKGAGINRLSIGIQSFDNSILKFLNRAHSSSDALNSVKAARQFGFENISIDLIFAIPGQSPDQWAKNIRTAIALAPEHISCYSLTIEEKTVFGNWQKKGKLIAETEEGAAMQMEMLMDLLESAGFEQYEISNFAKPRFRSRHNSNYWHQKKYLGIGPGAHSFNLTSRQFNVRNNWAYINSMAQGIVPYERETLTRANKINEYIMTSLRMAAGCDLDFLKSTYQYNLLAESASQLNEFIQNGLLNLSNEHLFLTRKGKLIADKIAGDIFVEE